eukprot:jgi/Bigna1/143703/aug1.80_g18411
MINALRAFGASFIDQEGGCKVRWTLTPSMKGRFLLKVSGIVVKEWQKRYCVLTKKEMRCYKASQKRRRRRRRGISIEMDDKEVEEEEEEEEEGKEKLQFLEKDRSLKPRNSVPLVGATIKLEHRSAVDKNCWVKALETITGRKAEAVRAVGSNKGILFTDGRMAEGCQVWTDKSYVYQNIPQVMKRGSVIRHPMRLPQGTILSFKLSSTSVLYLMLPDMERNGNFIETLTRLGWAEKAQKSDGKTIAAMVMVPEDVYKAYKQQQPTSSSAGGQEQKRHQRRRSRKGSKHNINSRSLKSKLIEAARGDEEKWIQIKNLSKMLKNLEISPKEYFHQFLMMYGHKATIKLFPDVVQY